MSTTSDTDSSAKPTGIMGRLQTAFPNWTRRLGYYGLALLFVAAAATLRWELREVLRPAPTLVFYLAWVGAAAFGGLGPGLLATVASWLCVDFLFDSTPGRLGFAEPMAIARLSILLTGGLVVSVVGEEMRRVRLRQRQQMHDLADLTQALRRSEERLHLAMESGKVGVWEWELGKEEVQWSQGVYALLGYEPGALPSTRQAFRRCIHPQDRARHEQAMHQALERCEDYLCEFRVVWPDGSIHWVEARGQYTYPSSTSATETVWMRGVLTDIDKRKQAEQALRESEERYRTLFESSRDGIIFTDMEGRILHVNPYYREMLGYSEEELHALTYQQLTPQRWREAEAAIVRDGILSRGYSGEYEKEYIRKDGTAFPISIQVWLVRDADGAPQGMWGIVRDITQRKQAEEALRELNATLESKVAERTDELKRRAKQLQKLTLDMSETEDRERQRMAEILHDDLQQQLAGAKFHLGLMRNRAKYDPSVQELGAKIDHMLKDAMEKSRSLSHELSPTVLHHADFTETLRWLANEMQAKHGLTVHVHAPAVVRAQSDALKGFLYKAAQELLFNIVKHAGVKEAAVRVRPCGGYICLAVSDHGRGFDPQELREAAGYGLLGIRERIELLGGRMKIKSARGKGSTLLIVVPNGEETRDRLPGREHTAAARQI